MITVEGPLWLVALILSLPLVGAGFFGWTIGLGHGEKSGYREGYFDGGFDALHDEKVWQRHKVELDG